MNPKRPKLHAPLLAPGTSTSSTRKLERKRLPLDVLLHKESNLLQEYTNKEELEDVCEKLQDLQEEILQALNLDGDIDKVIGAKMDKNRLWFYVQWEDENDEFAYVPASIVNKIAPDKVIKYYESILTFPSSSPAAKEEAIGVDKLQKRVSDSITDKKVNWQIDRERAKERERERERQSQLMGNGLKTQTQTQSTLMQQLAQKTFRPRTMNCTGCNVLLQYPEGTKVIKCPKCHAVMHSR